VTEIGRRHRPNVAERAMAEVGEAVPGVPVEQTDTERLYTLLAQDTAASWAEYGPLADAVGGRRRRRGYSVTDPEAATLVTHDRRQTGGNWRPR